MSSNYRRQETVSTSARTIRNTGEGIECLAVIKNNKIGKFIC